MRFGGAPSLTRGRLDILDGLDSRPLCTVGFGPCRVGAIASDFTQTCLGVTMTAYRRVSFSLLFLLAWTAAAQDDPKRADVTNKYNAREEDVFALLRVVPWH